MNEKRIIEIIASLESGYNEMSEKFSQTRNFFWRDLVFISNYIESGDKILDFGCGNGRLVEILRDKDVDYTGADISQKLVNLAKSRYPARNFLKLSGQDILPFSDEYFNKVISIAVFHHFPYRYAREMAKELYRVTRSGGKIIITVWNLQQLKYRKYFRSPKIILEKIIKKGGLGWRDGYIPFQNNQGKIFQRFHHSFSLWEFQSIFKQAGFSVDNCFVHQEKNIVFIGTKVKKSPHSDVCAKA